MHKPNQVPHLVEGALMERGVSYRRVSLALAAAAMLIAPSANHATAQEGTCTRDATWGIVRVEWVLGVVELTNQHRASLGLSQLRASRSLTSAALWKAAHMAAYNYFAHDDPAPPTHRTWDQRIRDCGYTYGVGENIAAGYASPTEVMQGWLGSPGHRANIERAEYKSIGVGAVADDQGSIYWVQVLGLEDDSPSDAHSPPQAIDDDIQSPEDMPVEVAPLVNDVDPDGDPLGLAILTASRHGEVSTEPDYRLRYMPQPNFHGEDSLTYTLTDVFGFTATGAVSIRVTPVNDAPVAVGEFRKVRAGRRITVAVLYNDDDIDGDTVALIGVVDGPSRGRVVSLDQAAGTIIYRSRRAAAGRRDQLVYRIGDGNGGYAEATIRLKIRARR
jgi:uncharacterized protein YkwD